MYKIFFSLISIVLMSWSLSAHAGGVGPAMGKFLKGGVSNTTKGGAYHDQASGHYSGGSYSSRSPVVQKNFANIQMPSINAGCNGIDLFMGSMSFISGQELIQAGKSIVSAAPTYAANLALKTMSPELAAVLSELQAKIQEINEMNINSCQAAQTLVGGIWPKSEAASAELCQRMGTSDNVFADRVKARHECGSGKKALTQNQTKSEKFVDNLGDEYNLAWEAIKKNGALEKNKMRSELFMSVSGTILSYIKKGEESIKHEILPSLALNNELLKALIDGGAAAEIYACKDEDKCLEVVKKKVSFSTSDGVKHHVQDMVTSIRSKASAVSGATLSPAEKSFIEQTNLPVLKYIQQSILRGSESGIISLEGGDYVELVAYDLLLNYLNEILDVVKAGINHIRTVQLTDGDIKNMLRDIDRVKKQIGDKQVSLYARAEAILKFNDAARQIEMQTTHTFYESIKGE